MKREHFIAHVRYLGWVCYQMGAGLPLHGVSETYEISTERFNSLVEGTLEALKHTDITPEENHKLWMETKEKQGYKYGTVIDTLEKTHPSMIPYEQLSDIEKQKDTMDILMVKLASNLFDKLNDKQSEA